MKTLPAFLVFLIALTIYPKEIFCQSYQIVNGDTINFTDADTLKQGIWRAYYKIGPLKEEIHYKDGRKNGMHLIFYSFPNCLKEESSYRNDTLNGPVIEYFPNCNIRKIVHYSAGIQNGYERVYHPNGNIAQEGKFENGKLHGFYKVYDTDGSLEYETSERIDKINLEGYVTGEVIIQDSIIFKGLEYLHLDEGTVIVTDVTGSMYAFVGQLLLWYSINFDTISVKHFVFFNDGNKKNTRQKTVGKTGGVYTISAKKPDDIKRMMEIAIEAGTGGDAPENDMEAVITGQKKFRNVTQVILVADGKSRVRDFSLVRHVKVPVHIIA
nr:hypothetical protein [Bacteroidota bacterium]